jgi:two-component system nitrate/nitrite response regulator NarL
VPEQGAPITTQTLSSTGPQPKVTALAPREQQIVDLISRGWTDKGIAVELGVSVRTVRTHLERLYRKRRLHSRAEAVALWIHGGM